MKGDSSVHFFLLMLISSGCLNIGQEHCGIYAAEWSEEAAEIAAECLSQAAEGSGGVDNLDLPSLYRLAPNVWGYSHRRYIVDMLVNITASGCKRKGQLKNKVIRELLGAIN